MTSISVRGASLNDLSEIELLLKKGFSPEYVNHVMIQVTERMKNKTIDSFLAIYQSKAVGYVAVKHIKNNLVSFGPIVVDPDYRGMGIGLFLGETMMPHLEQSHFSGTAYSDTVVNHTNAQRILWNLGFRPASFRLEFTYMKTCGFYRLFQGTTQKQKIVMYLPEEYKQLAEHALGEFCLPEILHPERTEPSRTLLETYVANTEHFDDPMNGWRVPLEEETCAADIAYLRQHKNRHYCAGFKPFIEDDKLKVYAYMGKIPKKVLDAESIKVIPEAHDLFQFVWKQYEQGFMIS